MVDESHIIQPTLFKMIHNTKIAVSSSKCSCIHDSFFCWQNTYTKITCSLFLSIKCETKEVGHSNFVVFPYNSDDEFKVGHSYAIIY